MTLRTGAIVQALGGELFGDADRLITRLAPLESAQPSELSFLVNPRLTQVLAGSQAGCVIVGAAMAEAGGTTSLTPVFSEYSSGFAKPRTLPAFCCASAMTPANSGDDSEVPPMRYSS